VGTTEDGQAARVLRMSKLAGQVNGDHILYKCGENHKPELGQGRHRACYRVEETRRRWGEEPEVGTETAC